MSEPEERMCGLSAEEFIEEATSYLTHGGRARALAQTLLDFAKDQDVEAGLTRYLKTIQAEAAPEFNPAVDKDD